PALPGLFRRRPGSRTGGGRRNGWRMPGGTASGGWQMDILATERNFASLGLADLVEARDTYHWHLTHQRNVIGTAVGLYYIRTSDPWPSSRRTSPRSATPSGSRKPARTFQNSEIRDYSW